MNEHEIQRELIDALLDGELAEEEKVRVEKHIKQCAECRIYSQKAKQLREAFAAMPRYQAPAALVERVKRQAGMRHRTFWLSRSFVSAFSAAAVVVIAVAVTITQYGRDEDIARRAAETTAVPMKREAPATDAEDRYAAAKPAAGEDRIRLLHPEEEDGDKDATLEGQSDRSTAFGKAAAPPGDDEAGTQRKGWSPSAPKPTSEAPGRFTQRAAPKAAAPSAPQTEPLSDAGLSNQAVGLKSGEGTAPLPLPETAASPSPVRGPAPSEAATVETLALRDDAEAPEPPAAMPEEPREADASAGRRRVMAKSIGGGGGRGAAAERKHVAAREELLEAGPAPALSSERADKVEKAKADITASTSPRSETEKKAVPRYDVLARFSAGSPSEAAELAMKEARKRGFAVSSVEAQNGRLLFLLTAMEEAQTTAKPETGGEPAAASGAEQRIRAQGADAGARQVVETKLVEQEETAFALEHAKATGAVQAEQRIPTAVQEAEGLADTEAAQTRQAAVLVDLIPVIEVAITPRGQAAGQAVEAEADVRAKQAAPAENNAQ